MQLIPEDADYDTIRWRLRSKIDRDIAAGSPRNAFVSVDERLFAEHDAAAKTRHSPCDACGQPWPCSTVLGILAPE